jgi:hypothetical protein
LFTALRALNCACYGLSLYATTRPGRIDGPNQDELDSRLQLRLASDKKSDSRPAAADPARRSAAVDDATTRRGRSLLVPAPWAFAIWGPIFAGELAFCAGSWLLPRGGAAASAVTKASAGFAAAQLFQVLWTASFRPRYFDPARAGGLYRHVSSLMLAGIAHSMGRAHAAYASRSRGPSATALPWGQYALCFLPMTLHFGWTTAATLVNVNGNVAASRDATPRRVAAVGHASSLAASALGLYLTVSRRAPVLGLVVAWALAGCAATARERVLLSQSQSSGAAAAGKGPSSKPSKAEVAAVGTYGASEQLYLCGLGAVANIAASLFVVLGG